MINKCNCVIIQSSNDYIYIVLLYKHLSVFLINYLKQICHC